MQFFKIALGFSALVFASATPDRNGHWDSGPKAKTCVVKAGNSTLIDDAPAILDAFDKCGHNGKIVFLNTTYHVNSVMNTTGLKNVDIDLRGTLVWSTNTSYWLNNSLPVGYQNQSSAWIFGGDNINFQGNGYGRFDGNGAAWVSCCGGKSNYPGRPHAITIINTHNSLFEGITFWKSQMWTMAIIYSSHILMQDITVNNALSRNTDGANTLFSDHITFNRWSVTGSDDSIAIKANSTNIAVTNSNFYNGLGLAFGSIGQYKDVFETIENITATNITCDKTLHAAYIKTWTGQQVGYPPNGGGGGLGYIKNVLMSDIRVTALRGFPFSITQCTTFSGVAGDCNTSLFQLSDIILTNISGTITSNPIAAIQCSAAAPCHDIVIKNVELDLVNGTEASGYLCSALRGNGTLGENGFVCTGSTCGKSSATGSC